MIRGYLFFLEWVDNHFSYLDSKKNSSISRSMIREASLENFENLMRRHYKGFGLADLSMLVKFMMKQFDMNFFRSITALGAIQGMVVKQQLRIFLSFIKQSLKLKDKIPSSI